MAETDSDVKKKLERLRHLYGLEYEMIRATAAFEHAALRPLFMLNGGALVVYMGLYGALGKRGPEQVGAIDFATGKFAAISWLVGLLAATVAAYQGARSQFAFRKLRGAEVAQAEMELGMRDGSAIAEVELIDKHETDAHRRRRAAVIAGMISFGLFMAGFWPAFASI